MIKRIRNWWEYSALAEFFVLAVLCILVIGAVAAIVFPAVYKLNQWECQDKTSAMERDYEYGFIKGCLVEDDGGDFVPLDNWRHEESVKEK